MVLGDDALHQPGWPERRHVVVRGNATDGSQIKLNTTTATYSASGDGEVDVFARNSREGGNIAEFGRTF